eukprot:TRINITY_DN38377_c0_g1_i1.p1 TRINITY_DN38377_c0_g1~~TRINITY_DN38377_c0_g1_i1.p1  ORF type:complete len:220 (+),score=15.92 TRINITY_DN38377_c0_g1_i1:3-662(+)
MMSSADVNFLPRKGRSDKGATTSEVVPRFVPIQGPPEQGVIPGSHAWEHAPVSDVVQRKAIDPSYVGPAGGSDPNEICQKSDVTALKFIGGKAQVRGPAEQGVADSLTYSKDGMMYSLGPGYGASCDPNSLAEAQPMPKVSQKAHSVLSPRPAWSGPASGGGDYAKSGRRFVPHNIRQCSEVSHSMQVPRKSDHMTSRGAPRTPTTPRREYTPRYVPSM